MKKPFIHPTADVSKQAELGANAKVWHQCQIRENARIGDNSILGKNVYIDHDVVIGSNVKVQNNASVYFGSKIEDGVFIGPNACLTNDKAPRAIAKNGKLKTGKEWVAGRIIVKKGASIGAGSVILPDVTIGRFAMIGAGSLVTKSVPDYALVYGSPAELKGYVCRCGAKIKDIEEKGKKMILFCAKCREKVATAK
ncbi:N-acetyltransferase [Candidatus Woesearchaeota archaeon]|nr:N-acetyltransferase [Candidatus Woesearchaeota archaeon]